MADSTEWNPSNEAHTRCTLKNAFFATSVHHEQREEWPWYTFCRLGGCLDEGKLVPDSADVQRAISASPFGSGLTPSLMPKKGPLREPFIEHKQHTFPRGLRQTAQKVKVKVKVSSQVPLGSLAPRGTPEIGGPVATRADGKLADGSLTECPAWTAVKAVVIADAISTDVQVRFLPVNQGTRSHA